MATQTLVSELLVKLKQDVSGPAAEAKKALAGIESQLAAIGKQKAAEDRLIALAKRQEDLRERVRSFGQTMMESEKVTAAQAAQYRSLTSGLDKAVEAYRRQQQAVENGAQALDRAGVAARNYAEAEARLVAQAEGEVRAINQAVKEEERRQRLRESWLKESRRAIEEEARERVAAEEEALRATRTAEAERQRLARETAQEQARLDQEQDARQRRFRESWLKDSQRAIEEEMRGRERAAKEAQRIETERQRRIVEERNRATHGATGFLGMVAGMEVEHLGVESVKSAAELEKVKVDLARSGLTPDQVTAAFDRSAHLQAQYPNLRRTEIMGIEKQAYTILPHQEEVPEYVPTFARFASAYKVGHPGANEEEVNGALEQFFKASELEGSARTAESFSKSLDAKLKALNYQSGLIKPDDFLGFAKQAGGAATMLSEEFRNKIIPLIMAEMGGQRTGTAIQAINKQAVGDFEGNGHALAEWIDMGLIRKDQVLYTKQGKPLGLKPGEHPKGYEDMVQNPLSFSEHTLMPAIDAGLAKRQKKMTAAERAKLLDDAEGSKDGKSLAESHPEVKDDMRMIERLAEIRRMFPNAVAARMMQELVIQQQALRNHQERMDHAPGLETADMVKNDPIAAMNALKTSIANFASTVGNPIMKDAANYLSSLSTSIAGWSEAIARWQKDNPDLAKRLAGTAGVTAIGGGFMASWFGLEAFKSGFGLRGSAVALTHSAAALEAAAVRLGAGAVAGTAAGVAGAEAAAASGGLMGLLKRGSMGLLKGGAFAWLGNLAADVADPGGNLWGLTSPVDRWVKAHFGFDPSKFDPIETLNDRAKRVQEQNKSDAEAGRLLDPTMAPPFPSLDSKPSPLPPSTEHGERAGTDLGNGIAQGLNKQSGPVQSEAERMYESLKALFMQPISVPIRLETQGLQQAAASVRASVNNQMRTALHAAYTGHDWA